MMDNNNVVYTLRRFRMAKKLIFGDNEFPVPEGMTLDEAQDWASEALPAITDAEGLEDDDGNFVFRKKAGSKGF